MKLATECENESSTNVDYPPTNYNFNDRILSSFLKFSPILVDSVASTLRGLIACEAFKTVGKLNCTLVDLHF